MKRYLAVLVLLVCGAVACARTPQMLTPAPPEARAHSHRIGILEPPRSCCCSRWHRHPGWPPGTNAGWANVLTAVWRRLT